MADHLDAFGEAFRFGYNGATQTSIEKLEDVLTGNLILVGIDCGLNDAHTV
jgi:hypothetical protein